MAYNSYLLEFGEITIGIIKDALNDYIDYKRAQRIEWRYQHNKFCGVVGMVDQKTLEAMTMVFEFQKRKRELKERLRRK